MKVLVVGGGTAGHITPLVAVMQQLRKQQGRQLKLHLVTQRGDERFSSLFDEIEPIRHEIFSGKIRRYAHWQWWKYFTHFYFMLLNIRDSFLLLLGFFQSLVLLMRIRPDVVFSKGGFVGLPVGVAAGLLGIPLVTHDSDARLGLSNRILRRWATARAKGMPSDDTESTYTGTPVREEFKTARKSAARKQLGISVRDKVIVVSGGSLGAQKLNDALIANLNRLNASGYWVFHLGGVGDYERLRRVGKGLRLQFPEQYRLLPFVNEELAQLYAAADVVVSRAGATTIAELAAVGKAVIFVPDESENHGGSTLE